MTSPHLVGAYGMFWDRDEVDWRPGSGPAAWQLLGRIHTNKPKIRVCDFRRAQGFYVLFDDFRASYVGLARGRYGIGARLRKHYMSQGKEWSRFCWFSFDDVVDHSLDSWSRVHRRAALRNISSEMVLRECEALLITHSGRATRTRCAFRRHGAGGSYARKISCPADWDARPRRAATPTVASVTWPRRNHRGLSSSHASSPESSPPEVRGSGCRRAGEDRQNPAI